jgi:ABC-type branched-subunit amino acid transport system substrate-binding protein
LLERLRGVHFADPSLIGVLNQVAAVTGQQIPELSLPMPSVRELLADAVSFAPVCAGLVLPLTGPYAEPGAGVQAGATLAADQMRQAGIDIALHFIDTGQAGWAEQLAALPASCALVGGPMQPDAYAEMRSRNIMNSRAVFAFLARIDDGDEGGRAWRFFPAREDQILAMQRFAVQMGVHSFGVFHPDDAYGNAMAGEFAALAPGTGGAVTASLAYPADSPEQWPKLAGSFVGVRVVNKLPIPSASFRAVFLPDSWSSMDMAVSSLFYQGADSNLLLGTSLWEQNLLESPPAVLNNMSLAVFPGMWNPRSLDVPARLLQGGLSGRKADTWTALGYDFVRFASAMNLQPGWTPQTVNERLAYARNMKWSMAPLDWHNGRARQTLFVMTPVAGGEPALVDPALFKQRLDGARLQSERRQARALGRRN